MFSVLYDEMTGISHTSQLSLGIRYLFNGNISEDFITFCDAYASIRDEDIDKNERRLTGEAITHIVENLLMKLDVDIKNCVGIGTNSCSTMASEVQGAAKVLMKKAIYAKRCPCSNHVLNNSLARSSSVSSCIERLCNNEESYSFCELFLVVQLDELLI